MAAHGPGILEACASHKSFRPKDGSDFRGKKRGNDTHAPTTDPVARLMRKGKGKEAKLSYHANTLMKNRHGLLVAADVRHATGTSERDAALALGQDGKFMRVLANGRASQQIPEDR